MKNKEYCFCIEDDEVNSFLSFCEVNKITFGNGNRFPLGETTFVLKDNEIAPVKLSDDDDCDDWDGFVEEYYSDLFSGMSTKDIINKLKSDRYSFSEGHFIYGYLSVYCDDILGLCDEVHYDLLEIIFKSSELIGHPENSTVESKSYLDFNPFKRA